MNTQDSCPQTGIQPFNAARCARRLDYTCFHKAYAPVSGRKTVAD